MAILHDGGAYFGSALGARVEQATSQTITEGELEAALWSLAALGRVSNDALASLRARRTSSSRSGGAPAPTVVAAPVPVGLRSRTALRGVRAKVRSRTAAGAWGAGRWFAVQRVGAPDAAALLDRTLALVDRYGIVTRGSVIADGFPGGFAAAYKFLAGLEDTGQLRRVYAIEGLGGAQFAAQGAVDALRGGGRPQDGTADSATGLTGGLAVGLAGAGTGGGTGTEGAAEIVVLAAADPANAYGAALPWPDSTPGTGHLPGRRAGAMVVLMEGRLVMYLERGGSALLTFSAQEADLKPSAQGLAATLRSHRPALRPASITIRRIDGGSALTAAGEVTRALESGGFAATPQGFRLR
jgi:ATP-dependent Lhr-like helicase